MRNKKFATLPQKTDLTGGGSFCPYVKKLLLMLNLCAILRRNCFSLITAESSHPLEKRNESAACLVNRPGLNSPILGIAVFLFSGGMMADKRSITGVRLNEAEREALLKIGKGSISKAIKQGISMLFTAHDINVERTETKNRRTQVIDLA